MRTVFGDGFAGTIFERARTKKQHFISLAFCVLLVFGGTLFAADFEVEIPLEFEYQTMNVHPGTVSAVGWKNPEETLPHEVNDDGLYRDFNNQNSARAVRIGEGEMLETVGSTTVEAETDTASDTVEGVSTSTTEGGAGGDEPVVSGGEPAVDDAPEVSDVTENSIAPTTPEEETAESVPETVSSETEAVTAPESIPEPEPEPIQEPAPVSEPEAGETPLQSLSKSFFRFVERATKLLPFAQESIVEPVPDVPSEPEPESAPIEDVSEPEPVPEAGVTSEKSPEPVSEEVPAVSETESQAPAPVAGESTVSENGGGETATSTVGETPSGDAVAEDEGEGEEEATPTGCREGACVSHVLEFGDFTVGGDMGDQQITNMQLRISIGARPHRDVVGERIRVEYLHYDYWMPGGEILIDDEVSNAVNGGYQLFAFPLYSDWEELSRIKVRLTYESDNEHLADIFVDSVWLEIESIDGDAFNDPDPSPALKPATVPLVNIVPDEYYYDFISEKSEFSHDEDPRFVFDLKHRVKDKSFFERLGERVRSLLGFDTATSTMGRIKMRVVDDEFRGIATIAEQENGAYVLDIPKTRQFKPGKHTITIEVTDGDTVFYLEQEFTWGVLALNTDKSVYLPGEEGHLQMGVLDEMGHTICDAVLNLEVRGPSGVSQYLSTENGTILYGEECAGDTFITTPDYDAYYTFTDGLGAYEFTLTALTENGTHTTVDQVEVRDAVPFTVVREGPTRIYPIKQYPVALTVTAHEDYVGEIIELVPVSFQVYGRGGVEFRTRDDGDVRQLIWDVDMKAGETIELSYRFDAPDTSPEFYLVGPLTIGTFAEIREWQIASDAPSNAVIVQSVVGTPVSATSYSATFGSAPTPGNIIVMIAMTTDGASAFNAPASYLTQVALSNAGVEIDIGMWWAHADSASTTYTITKTGGNQTGVVALFEVAGLDTTNPVDVATSNDQTGSNSRTAYTGATTASVPFAFALAAVGFGDNDFNNPTSADWTSDSANPYTQDSWTEWATGNDGSLGLAYTNVNIADTQGATLTVTGGGSTEQRNSVIGVFRLAPQTNTVGARGNQVPQLKINTANNYVGGAFTIATNNGTTSVTSITISEAGTTDASVDLSNIRLYYEFDTTNPYDCASESYGGSEVQYGATSTAFSSANGTATFVGSITVATTSTACFYPVLNVDSSATAGHTVELQITNPTTDVVTGTGSTSPGTAVSISDTSTISLGYSPTVALLETPAFPSMRATTTEPTFGGFVGTDADGDAIEFEFSIDDDLNFGSPATTTYSSNYPTDTGWASSTFPSGATTTYRIGETLTPGTTYWWRVRGRDPLNTNTWGQYSEERSITVGSDITVPEWFETTGGQFSSTTASTNAVVSGDSVAIDDLSTSVALLNAWSTGNTKVISSGSNRLLIVAIVSEDSGTDVNVNTVTYGGQTLTEITDQQIGTGFANGMWVGYLDEARIALSSGTTITPTWTGSGTPTPNAGIQYMSAVFSDVNQTDPIRSWSANQLTSGTTITPSASTTVMDGDMMFYVTETEDSLTHTPHTGYTEGTEQDTGGTGFVNASAYKAITVDGTELPTATWSASGNRLLMVAASIAPYPSEGTVMSKEIDFDWVANQNDWGEVRWATTEFSEHDTRLRVYYGTSTACSTRIPDSALPGNSVGFSATSSPLDISSLATTTYNRICLEVTLSEGATSTSPTLNDWTVTWEKKPVFNQLAYRWYANTGGTITPVDTWPEGTTTAELGESEPIVSDYPTKTGDVLRLRIGAGVSSTPATASSFKLQYAEGATCDAELSWADVAPVGSTTALWRGYNNASIADGATLGSSTLTSTDEFETYEEENASVVIPNAIAVGDQGEWDWVIENRATAGASYCFRMVTSDGALFKTYAVYPQLITNQAPAIITADKPFDNEKLASTSPWFEFIGVDPEGELLDYQIQIDNNNDFSSTAIDTDSSVNLTDFENVQTPSDKSPFNNEERIRYTVPSSLTNGTTYWWRVRVKDSTGSDSYGEWSTAQSFTVDTGVTITTWFQTTEEQFDTDTLEGTDATGANLLTLATGSTTGTTTSSVIDFDNLTTGNAWGTLSWTDNETTGDIKYHIEYYDGASWTLVPDGDLLGNSAGFDTSPVDLIDLDTETYNELRIRANFTNSGGAPTLSDWTVEWGERVSVPTHLLLFDNEKTGTTTPIFTFYTTDPEGDDLEYEFSYSTDNTFATGSTTVNSSTSPGFLDLTDNLDTNPFGSGDTIQYTVQTPLSDNVTYWWRVRAKDPYGSGSYSFWSNPWSFTVASTATTSTWFQTTQEQFDTDTLVSTIASTSDAVTIRPATVRTYNFVGITTPSATHVARDFEVDVNDPTDPPTVDEIDTLTTNGTTAGTPNLRTAIAGYASDAEATNAQYTNISTSNNVRWTLTDPGNEASGDSAVFWARFDIAEDPSDIAEIEVNLEGYQAVAVDKAWLGIWRPGSTTPYWQHLDDGTATTDTVYTGIINTNISQYLDPSGYLYIIFYNEDVGDPIIVDYVEVVVTTNAADSGTVTGTPVDFNDGSGPAWGEFRWNDTKPGASTLTYQLEYLTGAGAWALIPDSAIAGNSTGLSTSPVNLKFLDTDLYNEIRPVGNLTCDVLDCPSLNDWTITWSPGFTITGTAFEYDGTSSTTSGTVAVAVNGVLQNGKTGTIANGSWSIPNVTFFEGDVVTVFVSGAVDADEAVAVTAYDGVPDMSGLRLQKRHLTIGSDDYGVVTNAELALYDFTNDEDLFFDVNAGNDLSMCADVSCGDASIRVLPQNTYSPGTGADVATHDVRIDGTFVSGANTVRVSGSWDNNATTTLTGSTVIFTATSTAETVDSTGALSSTFNNVTFGEGSGTATWTLGSMLNIFGNLSVSYGTLARQTLDLTVAGNLTTGAGGFWSGMGTTTFDGINPGTWTDQNAVKQNIGQVVVDGTSKTVLLGSNVTMQSMHIGANDTFDLSVTGHTASVYGDWINNNTFVTRTGTVEFTATTTNRIITAGGDAFYNLRFNGAGGSWAFTESDLAVTNNFTIATGTVTMPTGTTTVTGSWDSVGGTFAHNNALIYFNASGAKTIAASGTPFTNTFYNLRFTGSGSWSFLDTSATTTNDLTVTQGTVTFPTNTLAVGGSFYNTGGTFVAGGGTVRFMSASPEVIDTNASFGNLAFVGSGSWSFIDASVTAQGTLTVSGGTLTLPSGTLTVGGSLTNTTTIAHNNGTLLFNSADTGETVNLGNSSLYNMTFSSATGGWTIVSHATTTGNTTLTALSSFTLASGQTLAVGGTFTNSVGGAGTTWTDSTLSLEAGNYSMNAKTSTGDTYGTLRVRANTDIKVWNSSATVYDIDGTGSLYSQDHAGIDGDLYIFGAYERTSGIEYWSYTTDFDGTALTASTSRQVDVRIAGGATASILGSGFYIIGSTTATTTVENQGSGTYTITGRSATTTWNYYDFANLGLSGITLTGTGTVTSLSDGSIEPGINGGTGLTVASTTVNANPGFQIYRVDFSTTTAVSATNVTQIDGAPTSYWWFRQTTGNIDGEAFDNDTGDPGSIRWDDSSLVITVSGVVYERDEVTPMGAPTCDDVTANIRIVVEGGSSYTGSCASADGAFSIPGVVVVGDPVVTVYLNTNGGARGTVVTRTPTADITDLSIIENRVVTRHEDVEPMTILKMATYDYDNDTDIGYTAATGTLTLFRDTELHVASSTTFAPGGDITLNGNASSTSFDGSLHIDDNATVTGSATSTYSIAGSFTLDQGATFTSASTTVLMNATTTGKTITTTASQEITFYDLVFNGAGGGWNVNGDIRALGDIDVTTGTVSGTADIAVVNGSISGNGLLSMGVGTTTIYRTNTLGGTTPWTFANLVLGNGSVVGTTTPATPATTTVLGKLTIGTAHYLDAGASIWNLSGTGNVFVEQGTFLEDTSTVRYSGAGATNITSTTYYNLDLMAQGGSPTYTGVGLGIVVSGNLTVGGATTTTANFDTSDPALDVNGNVTIDTTGTLVGSGSAVFTVGGNWDNNGTFTGSGGTVTFDNGGTKTIAVGNSPFSNVIINGAGDFTITEPATTTATFTLINATSFTVANSQSLAVGGTFTNAVGGVATTWTGSTLHLYGGGNYEINASTAQDTYERLVVSGSTQIRMWNSNAVTYDVGSSASLYSQDHGDVTGDLYIFGSYVKTSGTDHWSYATDFDGSALGSPRIANVRIASGGSVLYTGGGLAVVGSAGASTTIDNQGSGTYALRIGGTASTTWSYYDVQHTNSAGLTFSGTPNIVTLSRGSFTVSGGGGTAMTVGGTVITQNPARTFTSNSFGTTTGVSGFNITATGTSASSWRFTNHSGTIDGEAYDVDPNGDPGYIVWDDSSANITVSGTVYSGEGSGVSTACDGSTQNIHLRVAGLTSYTGSCDAGTGAYAIGGVLYSPGDSFVVYIDGEAEKAATVSEDPVSNVSGFDLYENRIIVRHESSDPISIADMSLWDSSDDADIPFTAVDGAPDTLTLPANRKLIIWTGKEFEPQGNVTVSGGGGGSAYDGTLELYGNAIFDATGSESHTVGGSLIMGTNATLDDETSTFTFTTSGAARTVDTNDSALYNVVFNGSGSWTVTNTAFTVGNDLTVTLGAVTLPSGTTTVTGSLSVTSGSFNANGGTMLFNSGASETIAPNGSSFSTLTVNGTGSFTLSGANATATADVRILDGSFTSVSGTFAIGGDFTNSDTFTHNSGTLRFTSGSGATVTASSSTLGSVTFAGAGAHTFTGATLALSGSLRIEAGSVLLPSGTMSVAGSLVNSGGSFNNASGTILFNSSDTGETVNPGDSPFHNISFASAGGGWTVSGSATTTGNFSLTAGTSFTLASSTRLYVGGVFTNTVGGAGTTWTGSTLVVNSGTGYTVNTKVAGGDTYGNLRIGSSTALRMWDSTASSFTLTDTTSSLYSQDHAGVAGSLYIFGNYVRSSGADYWSYATDFDGTALGGSSRQAYVYLASGASTTIVGGTLSIVGANGFDTTISNQGSGTYGMSIEGGTFTAQYYSLSNMGAKGLNLEGNTTVTSLTEGNFVLAVSGGSLITLSSTTLNYNAGLTVVNTSFATTSAITGYNVNLVGTTPSAWTFTGHSGNFDGEAFDNDGGDDCGSIRWDDSSCLLVEQSAYRWRNDDGGEGVPNSEWYSGSWTKRTRVTVTNEDAVTYTDATVKLTIPYDSDMQADFDDLRFTEADGVTELSYFRESYTASTDAVIWVKVPTLATSSSAVLYVYYGNGSVSDGSATTTFAFMDNFEDGNSSEYSGDTSLFAVDGSFAYDRSYGLDATGNESAKATDGIYRTNVTVSQGQTLRYFQYIDTTAGAADETCTLFGVQSPGSNNQNYAVCLELFGVDRVSLARDVDYNDTSGVVLASSTVSYVTGWHEVEVDWKTNNTVTVSVFRNGSVVATVSATTSTYTSGGVGFTFWGQNGGWDIYSARPYLTTEPTVTLGSEQVPGGASWIGALNTPASGIQAGEKARIRFLVENSGLPITAQNFELEYAPKGIAPSCESVNFGDYVPVPPVASCGTSDICMAGSSNITNLEATSDLLGGTGTFLPGQLVEDPSNKTGSLDVDSSEYTEVEYVITPTVNTTDSAYCFRVTDDGVDLDSYARVAELQLVFFPDIFSLSLNGNADIILVGGATTTVTATGTVSDQNGYTDLIYATTTIYRSGVGESCTADNNNCYIAGPSQCSFVNCSGSTCDVECSVDVYYHADPTDIGTYAGQSWRAFLTIEDGGGATATATAPSIDLISLQALAVDNGIDYGTLSVNADTGSYNATTTVENIGNTSIDVAIEGTDLTDGGSSAIPVSEQIFATSTFTYSACTFCSQLASTSLTYNLNLTKPTSTTPAIVDEIFWGIAVPFGVAGTPHSGVNTFYAVPD